MTKTILFAQPNSPLIQQLQQEGRKFILAEDPIKTLKAMKKLQKRGEYVIVGDEQSTKYLEFAKKMGYQEYQKPKLEPPKSDGSVIRLEETILSLNEGYKEKIKVEKERIEKEYKDRLEIMKLELEEKSKKLEEETRSIQNIKKKIKEQIYAK